MAPLQILVVDDDALVLSSTSMMVEDLGHHAIGALSGTEALSLIETRGFDLVITDFAMPGMNGAELIKTIARTHPSLPCLLATGYAVLPPGMPKDLIRLDKPFHEERLGEAIALALGSDPG